MTFLAARSMTETLGPVRLAVYARAGWRDGDAIRIAIDFDLVGEALRGGLVQLHEPGRADRFTAGEIDRAAIRTDRDIAGADLGTQDVALTARQRDDREGSVVR